MARSHIPMEALNQGLWERNEPGNVPARWRFPAPRPTRYTRRDIPGANPLRFFLLGTLFVAFTVIGTTLTVTLVVPHLPALLGVAPGASVDGWRALASVGLALPLVFGTLYAAGLLWLFCACHLFTRDEVERFMKVGPNTRLETWVLERFSR